MMKSLRKDTGGYALLYVMVIVFVLCAISMMICTVALRNLQSQEASVERMEEKYAAEGEIEKIKAKIESLAPISGLPKNTRDEAIASAEVVYTNTIKGYDTTEKMTITASGAEKVKIEFEEETTKIISELQIAITRVTSSVNDGTTTTYTTTITTDSISFTSYTIESTGGAA